MVSVVFVQFFASWHVPSVLSAGRRLSLRLHPRPAIAVAPLLFCLSPSYNKNAHSSSLRFVT